MQLYAIVVAAYRGNQTRLWHTTVAIGPDVSLVEMEAAALDLAPGMFEIAARDGWGDYEVVLLHDISEEAWKFVERLEP